MIKCIDLPMIKYISEKPESPFFAASFMVGILRSILNSAGF